MYKSSYTGSQIDEAVAKANEAAPQSTTYTKNEVDSALSGKQATLVVGTNLDSAPTENSTNPVTSGGVYQALSGKANTSDLGAAAEKGFDAFPTSGNTNNAVSSDGVYQALSAKLNTADSMKLVYRHFLGQNSGTVSYRMVTTDFEAIDNAQQCGMYLIAIIKWSATPTASIYIAYYSGGTLAYNALTKIGGADAQVEIDTERNIIYTGTGKIQIYALR